jgi:hypothetical protein
MRHTTHHRCPRAGLDPVDDAVAALGVLTLAVHRPRRDETIAVLLDDERRGIAIVVVAGTQRPDDVVEVVELLADPASHGGRVSAMFVASVRPSGDGGAGGPLVAGDVDRWLEMSELAESAGVELLEWFVVGDEIDCPRDLLGEAPRW